MQMPPPPSWLPVPLTFPPIIVKLSIVESVVILKTLRRLSSFALALSVVMFVSNLRYDKFVSVPVKPPKR